MGLLPAGITVSRELADIQRDTYLADLPVELNARHMTLKTDATLFAVGAQPGLYDNGHRGL